MLGLEALIESAIMLKSGNQEFILARYAAGDWLAGVGNSCPYVSLGEAEPDFKAEGETAEAAVRNLISKLAR